MRVCLLIAALVVVCGCAWGQDVGRDFAVGQRAAYLLAPAEVAVGSSVSWAQWRLDGRAMVALQTEESGAWSSMSAATSSGKPVAAAPVQPALVLWNRSTHKATTAYRFTSEKTHISQVEWIDGADVALVNVSEETLTEDKQAGVRQSLLRVPLSGEAAQVLLSEINTPSRRLAIWVADAPGKGPAYVLLRSTNMPGSASPATMESSVIPILLDGKLGRPIKTPAGYIAGDMYYDAQGRPWVRLQAALDAPSSPETRGAWGLLDLRAGNLQVEDNNQVLIKAPSFAEDAGARIKLTTSTEKLGIAKSAAAITPLWLAADKEGPHQFALVSADATMGFIAPSQDAVCYVSQGALVVREIVKAPLALVQAAVEQAERLAAISQAKQCVLALMMLAADVDDQLPTLDEYSTTKLEPYMKNPSDLNGFTYTFRGGRIPDIAAPKETEIGYVQGKSGRAVAYADTHVEWVADK